MALGKRSGVISATNATILVASEGADADDVIGGDGGPAMKKYGQHVGGAAHDGHVMHAGERLQGNVGDHPHYADQE